MVGPHSSNCPGLLYLECKAALDDTSSGTCQKKRHLIIERFEDNLGTNALVRIKDDYKPGSSVDDCQFPQDYRWSHDQGSWIMQPDYGPPALYGN